MSADHLALIEAAEDKSVGAALDYFCFQNGYLSTKDGAVLLLAGLARRVAREYEVES